jgi:hypothetical protein
MKDTIMPGLNQDFYNSEYRSSLLKQVLFRRLYHDFLKCVRNIEFYINIF